MLRQTMIPRIDSRQPQARRGFVPWLAAMAVLWLTSPAHGGEPTLEDCLNAPAGELARAYLADRYVLQDVLPMVEQGYIDTMVVGRDRITGRNAAKFRKRFEARFANYEAAIGKRGFADLSGRYVATATEACERAGSL